jgi:hypothetical protein
MKNKLACIIVAISLPISLLAGDPAKKAEGNTKVHDAKGIFYTAENFNLLTNPGFENGSSYWTLGKYNGGSATLRIDTTKNKTNSAIALIQTFGSFGKEYSDIQLFNFLEMTEKTVYSISFQAFVDKEFLISISVSDGSQDFFEEKLLLRPGQTNYGPFIFQSPQTESYSFFAFNLGRTNDVLKFDNIQITADHTEKRFDEVVSNNGFNLLEIKPGEEFYIQLPTGAKADYPVLLMDENGRTVFTDIIEGGIQEKTIKLRNSLKPGNYLMQVFEPQKTLASNIYIR